MLKGMCTTKGLEIVAMWNCSRIPTMLTRLRIKASSNFSRISTLISLSLCSSVGIMNYIIVNWPVLLRGLTRPGLRIENKAEIRAREYFPLVYGVDLEVCKSLT